jgi:hypothetical protein
MTQARRIEYNWIRGVETLEEYEPGGYHPIMVGDMLNGRYYIADKLGFDYSTVWLAHDTYLKQYVALKVNIESSLPREAKVLRPLSTPLAPSSSGHTGFDSTPSLLDKFDVQGPNAVGMDGQVGIA